MIIAVNFFSNLSNWKEEAWKNIYIYIYQGFNGIRTRDLRVADALLYQLSYEATHWERGQFLLSSDLYFIFFFRFQETALEVFSSDGRNHFLVFPKPVRSKVYEK